MRLVARLIAGGMYITPIALVLTAGCGGTSPTGIASSSATGTGTSGTGGSVGMGGAANTGGAGGVASTGGPAGTGGAASTGGTAGTGGAASTGGPAGTGGAASTGGTGGSILSTGSGGVSGATGTAATSTGSSTASGTTSTGSGGTVIATCQGHIYQCGDGVDNDGDGLIDSQDPDCLGPCDNTEGGFYGGIPGQAGPACTVDCYFDQDSGSGNDDCHWSHKCDPHEAAPSYYPESHEGAKCAYDAAASTPGSNESCAELYVTQSQLCHDYCGPLTPNGCDCFGCCELPASGGKYVWLGSEDANGNGSCTLADLADPAKCQPCLPVQACLNTCGHCELCIGKTTLPADCYPDPGSGAGGAGSTSAAGATGATSTTGAGGAGSTSTGATTGSGGTQCPAGVQACGLPGEASCPSGSYCITGCCQKFPG